MDKWSQLPTDLLILVDEKLPLYLDKIRMRSTCVSWWCSLSRMPDFKAKQLPWLLLPYDDDDNKNLNLCGFFNPVDNKVYNVEIPKVGEKLFKGSNYGWVVIIEECGNMYVFNPLTKVKYNLPHRKTCSDILKYRLNKPEQEYLIAGLSFVSSLLDVQHNRYSSTFFLDLAHTRYYYTKKVVLSSTPTSPDCVVMAIYGEHCWLGYCKIGEKKWTYVYGFRAPQEEVIFHKGKFYATNWKGDIVICEIGNRPIEIKVSPLNAIFSRFYLVEYHGELMMVGRNTKASEIDNSAPRYMHKTLSFTIYKFDISGPCWTEVKNLGDDMLFLGYNSSLSVSSRDFSGYRGNRIYFTDDHVDFYHKGNEFDEGVFDIDTGVIEPLPKYDDNSHSIWPMPIWVMPNPY